MKTKNEMFVKLTPRMNTWITKKSYKYNKIEKTLLTYLYLSALDHLGDRSDQVAEGPSVLRPNQ